MSSVARMAGAGATLSREVSEAGFIRGTCRVLSAAVRQSSPSPSDLIGARIIADVRGTPIDRHGITGDRRRGDRRHRRRRAVRRRDPRGRPPDRPTLVHRRQAIVRRAPVGADHRLDDHRRAGRRRVDLPRAVDRLQAGDLRVMVERVSKRTTAKEAIRVSLLAAQHPVPCRGHSPAVDRPGRSRAVRRPRA